MRPVSPPLGGLPGAHAAPVFTAVGAQHFGLRLQQVAPARNSLVCSVQDSSSPYGTRTQHALALPHTRTALAFQVEATVPRHADLKRLLPEPPSAARSGTRSSWNPAPHHGNTHTPSHVPRGSHPCVLQGLTWETEPQRSTSRCFPEDTSSVAGEDRQAGSPSAPLSSSCDHDHDRRACPMPRRADTGDLAGLLWGTLDSGSLFVCPEPS